MGLLEIAILLSALLSIIFSITGPEIGFYTCGIFVLVFDILGIVSGAIKYPFRILGFISLGVAVAIAGNYNTFDTVLFAVCSECIYTYVKGYFTIRRIKRGFMGE